MVVRILPPLIGTMIALGALVPCAADAQYGRGYRGYESPPPAYYDRRGAAPPAYYEERRGERARYARGRSRCDRGTGGTIIGAIAGGLLGNAVAGRGDRGVGTVVGAGAGALAGRSIDRDC